MNADDFDTDELKEHVKSRQTWLRLLYMVIFLFFAWVASFVFMVVVLVQFLWQLFSGKPNEQLRVFGDNFSTWGYQALRFLTFNSEDLPFPFDAWPDGSASGGGTAPRPRKKAAKKKKKTASSPSSGGSDTP